MTIFWENILFLWGRIPFKEARNKQWNRMMAI